MKRLLSFLWLEAFWRPVLWEVSFICEGESMDIINFLLDRS